MPSIISESEARKKWCPMVRIARRESIEPFEATEGANLVVVAGCNTDALGGIRLPASCRCIASDCMMWETAVDSTLGFCALKSLVD